MIATTIICSVLYPLYMVLRFHNAVDGWTRGFYSLMRDSLRPEQMWKSYDLTGMFFFEEHAQTLRHELRWHTGVRRRLSSPLNCWIQWGLAIAGIAAAWMSGNHWWLALPLASIYLTASMMNVMGWRWLRTSAAQYDKRIEQRKTDAKKNPPS